MAPQVSALLLLLCLSSPIVRAGSTASSLKSKTVCSGHRVNVPMSSSRAWLPLNHRHGPCSPLPSSGTTPAMADMLRRDQLRTDGIRRQGFNSGKQRRLPLKLGSSLDTMEYVVTVGLGTPAVNQTVYIDTGSDILWVQCRPCPIPPCHHQKDAMFDPARSATYSAIPCGSVACRGLGSSSFAYGCSGSLCQFTVGYADGSNTTGTYSTDKLTLTPTYSINGLRFGCSHDAEMYNDKADGIMGLGAGAQSLVSQTKERAFSYCLPPSESYSGFLTLGVPRVASSRFVVTPMYEIADTPDTPFYVVRLEGIAVAGRRLEVPASVFSDGAVMDSGAVITRLPTAAYRALRAAFREEMKMYPRADPTEPFDTCYDLDLDGEVKLPSVALVFERGATVELDRSGIILDGCLAFVSDNEPPTVIGNVQQRTFEVLYNVGGGSVGFRPGAC